MTLVARSLAREPVAWLMLGLPLLTLVAIVATIRVASHDAVDASHATTRRIAQVQIEDLSFDTEAARRGLLATLEADATDGSLVVTLPADVDAYGVSDELVLTLVHPIDAARDQHVSLLRDKRRWTGMAAPARSAQAWGVELADAGQHWRLKGRLARNASRAVLAPAVAR